MPQEVVEQVLKQSGALGRWLVVLALALAARAGFAIPGSIPLFTGLAQGLATGSLTLTAPAGIAADGNGNVYIADTGDNRIVLVARDGTASVLAISGLSPALSAPAALALDAAGDLYIADAGRNRVVEVTPTGAGSVVATGGVALAAPQGLAVDAAGDLFVLDAGNAGNGRIVEVPASGAPAVVSLDFTTNGVSPVGLGVPGGLAIDNGGNLYIADAGNLRILQVAATGSLPSCPGTLVDDVGTPVPLQAAAGIAVDLTGNLYAADGNQVVRITGPAAMDAPLLAPGTTLTGANAIAVSPLGQLFVPNGNSIEEIMPNAVDFGHLSPGSGSTTQTLPILLFMSPTVTAITATTMGAANQDFTVVPGGTLTSTTSGTVNVLFQPTGPGLRRGTLQIAYEGSFGPATLCVPLYGFADAPQATLNPATTTVLDTGSLLSQPFQPVLDGSGNLYVSNYSNNTVVKIPAGGGSAAVLPIPTLPAPDSLYQPAGMAVDGAGNLFISDLGNQRVVVLTPGGAGMALSIDYAGTFQPSALNFDAAGNLLVVEYASSTLLRVDAGSLNRVLAIINPGGTTDTVPAAVVSLGSTVLDIASIWGAMTDPAGNVWIVDINTHRILRVLPGGSVVAVPTGTASPQNPGTLALDPFGNAFVPQSNGGPLVQVSGTGGGYTSQLLATVGEMPSTICSGLAVAPDGSLILCDILGNRLIRVNTQASALSFPDTSMGETSAAQTVTVTNLGTQDLVFSATPAYTSTFIANPDDSAQVASGTHLAPGGTGDLSIEFLPQAAVSYSTTLNLTDDTLGLAGTTQGVSLRGTGTLPAPAIQASGLAFSGVGGSQFSVSWVRGNGSAVAAFMAPAGAGAAQVQNVAYAASSVFGAGSGAGPGWYCVYSGTGTGVTVTGLTPSTSYEVLVVEYNQSGSTVLFDLAAGSGNQGLQTTAGGAFSLTFGTDGTPGATLTGSTSQTVPSGGSATVVTANAPSGYSFVDWTGTNGFLATSANPLTLADVTASQAITAHFTANAITIPTPPPSSLTVDGSGQAAAAMTLGTQGSVAAPVTLSAAGLPEGAAITFSQNPVDLSGGPVTVHLGITTAPRLRIIGSLRDVPPARGLGTGALLACGLLALPGARRRKRLGLFLAALGMILASGLSACSSYQANKGITTGTVGTPAGTYLITLTAAAPGATPATTTFQLTIR